MIGATISAYALVLVWPPSTKALLPSCKPSPTEVGAGEFLYRWYMPAPSATDKAPPGNCASSRVPCKSTTSMVFVSLAPSVGANACASCPGVAVAKLNPLAAVADSAPGIMKPELVAVSSAYIQPSVPSISQPAALPRMSPKRRYVLVTNCDCSIPSCGKTPIRAAGALNG